MKDSGQLAREWEETHPERCKELVDQIEHLYYAHPTRKEVRAFYKTLTKEEKRGVIPEWCRRQENRVAPAGSLVRGRYHDPVNGHKFHFTQRNGTSTLSSMHLGTALVLGSAGHGSYTRYVMLQPPWVNKEGDRVVFAEAQSRDLEVLT